VGAQSSPSGYTALHLACLSGHVGVVRLLILHSPLILCSSVTIGGSVCGRSVLAIRFHGAAHGLPLYTVTRTTQNEALLWKIAVLGMQKASR
jgi:hypothetical protein